MMVDGQESTFEIVIELLRVVAQLLWPLSLIVALILFRREVRALMTRLRRGKFLGQELELAEEVQRLDKQVEAAEKAEPAKPLVDPAKDKVLQLAELQDAGDKVRRFLEEAAQDKVLALVRIWVEIELELRVLVATRGLLQFVARSNIAQCLMILVQRKAISQETGNSILALYELRNSIVHGRPGATFAESGLVALIDSGLRLLEILRSVPRQTYKVRAVVPFFSDALATVPVEGARAVVLETTSPDGKRRYAAYPTTKTYEPGQTLSWEWNLNRVWGTAWYRDSETNEIKHAWDSAGEFVGRPLESIT